MKKLLYKTLITFNIIVIALMLASGYAGYIDPVSMPRLSIFTLAFPLFALANLAFVVVWVFVRLRYVLIPVIGFLVAYVPVRSYTPFNVSHEPDSDCLKILTYNTWAMAGGAKQWTSNPIFQYVDKTDADFVCLQESSLDSNGEQAYDSLFSKRYPYHDTITAKGKGSDMLQFWSRYRILKRERIQYKSESNVSGAWTVRVGYDTIIFINNHLQSIGLTPEERSRFKEMVKGELPNDSTSKETHNLIRRLSEANVKRAPQAEAVADYIHRHRGKRIIVCGDFNSSPLSYTHHTICRDLTDCYIAAGNGPGISYHVNGFLVRIDNVMCSKHFTPIKCFVDQSINASDHYPVVCWLKKRR